MKSPYVNELQPNQVVTAVFLVQVKDVRQKKSGEPYLSLMLADRTGELEAKMWDNVSEILETFNREDFIKVKGQLQIYQNRRQLTIHKMVRIHDADVDFADYFPASERNPDEMFAELLAIIAGIENSHLRQLLQAFMADETTARLYRLAPAAKNVHHAFLGGLIEHVLSLCQLSRLTAAHYRDIDLDLLLTGVILHDIGKIRELTYDRGFGYSAEGQLLGHIVIGVRMLAEKLATLPEFPPSLRTLLEHMLISHHGELAFGSPKVPLFPEALLLHHLDNLDSKMDAVRALTAKDRLVEGIWTAYSSPLDRAILKKRKFLDQDGQTASLDDTPMDAQPVREAATPIKTPPSVMMKTTPLAGAPGGSFFSDKLQQALRKE